MIDALCATLPVDPEKLEAVKLWSQWDLEGAWERVHLTALWSILMPATRV